MLMLVYCSMPVNITGPQLVKISGALHHAFSHNDSRFWHVKPRNQSNHLIALFYNGTDSPVAARVNNEMNFVFKLKQTEGLFVQCIRRRNGLPAVTNTELVPEKMRAAIIR